MKAIKFSHNWNNKLDNDVFTTIRKFTSEKCDYYMGLRGERFQVLLNGNKVSEATLVEVRTYNYVDVDRHILALDTGICDPIKQDEVFNKFGCQDMVLILTFRK